MAKKEITIAFRHGGTIPAAVIGAKDDRRVPAHEAVSVPEAYGRHLIDDRFAYEVEGGTAPTKKAPPSKKDPDAIVVAEQAVADAKAKVADAGDDLVAKADAEAELKAAEEALAALKG